MQKVPEVTYVADSENSSSSNDDSDDESAAYVLPLSSNEEKRNYIHSVGMPGQLMCFLRVYDGEPVFGILADDVDPERQFGTCIMEGGSYVVFSCHALGEAAARCTESNYRVLCPRVALLTLLLERNKDVRALKFDLQSAVADYKIKMRRARQK